jgi:hypothetical protein
VQAPSRSLADLACLARSFYDTLLLLSPLQIDCILIKPSKQIKVFFHRLRAGNVLFNFKYYNNTMQKTEGSSLTQTFGIMRFFSFTHIHLLHVSTWVT